MRFHYTAAASLLLASTSAHAAHTTSKPSSSTSTYVEPTVPTGTPVPGNYTGGLRPQIHFSPPANFMNDPNGMFKDAKGIWHLYYQYDPTGTVAGNQHWGHATSKDLYHWVNQPIAIYPIDDFSYIFSGSSVIDVNNTSGFFPNQDNGVVAIYTRAIYYPTAPGPQTQHISISYDGGYTFTPYAKNPVLSAPDPNSSQFRDPKVFWYAPSKHWVMVVAFAQEFVVGIYTSPNLTKWTHASNFTRHGLIGLQYECPNMVQVPVNGTNEMKYVLMISINPGAPLGGSIETYYIGDFNGTHYEPMDNRVRISDFGKDRYAGQFFHNTPGEAVQISWASNWEYSQVVPTGELEGWRSSMSVPHKMFIANATRTGYEMFQEPYDLSPVMGPTLASNSSFGNGSIAADFSTVYSGAIYYEANITGLAPGQGTMNVTFLSPVSGETLQSGFFFGGDNPFFVNRGNIRGFDNVFFTDKVSAGTPINAEGTWSMKAVFDRSIYETWIDGGSKVSTTTFFPSQPLTVMTMAFAGLPAGAKVSYKVVALKSAWAEEMNDMGTVLGNVTTMHNQSMMHML